MSGDSGTMETNNGRIKRPLNRKTFIITLLLTMGIGITVLVAGFILYFWGVLQEYNVNTWHRANAVAGALEQTDYKQICKNIISVYDSMTVEERGDGASDEYRSEYAALVNEDFRSTQEAMRRVMARNGTLNSFVVALDRENNRMIYLIDSDPRIRSFCPPGTWDDYSDREIDLLAVGREPTEFERGLGVRTNIQAVLTNRSDFGRRCTAAATLFETDRYTVTVCVDEKLKPVTESSRIFLIQFLLLLIVITLIASVIGMQLMRKALVVPINRMARAAEAYGDDDNKQAGVRHFDSLDIHTGDELENLADALRDMEADVEEYLSDLTRATAEKERINTELSLAARIQKSMLTDVFPAFPDRTEFDIYASMEPAKAVGGDFYDMLLIDEDHLAVLIADVSGKGIPAALFMMASKIVLSNEIRNGSMPSDILKNLNDRLSARNEEEMFLTVWLGILEISSGRLVTANAGHEYPLLVHSDGKAEMIKDRHGFVIGGMSGMSYTDHEIMLEKGDSVFVYTDGVTEASTSDNELFGMERLIGAAGSAGSGAGPEQVLRTVREAVAGFVGDAEQFDDLTMLCLKYMGTDGQA